MKDIDRLVLEMLAERKFQSPRRQSRKERDITVKQLIKVLRKTPELKRELEDALKALEPKKKEEKKDGLSIGQKYMLWTLAAFTVPPMYIIMMSKLFASMGIQ